MSNNSEAQLNRKFVEFVRLLNIYLNHFPKHEKLRMQLHLANELGYFGYKDGRSGYDDQADMARKRYLAISVMTDELGRMIGGWIKKIKDDNQWK